MEPSPKLLRHVSGESPRRRRAAPRLTRSQRPTEGVVLRTMHLLATAIAVPFLAVAAFAAQESSARADGGTAFTYAVYGDAPYGAANHDVTQVLRTPAFIDSVNADPDVSRVIHVGDIHSGKDHCYQAYNTGVYDLWQGIPFTISGR